MSFRVLIIDDSSRQVEAVKAVLSHNDLIDTAYEAANGAKGLAIIQKEEVDLIICRSVASDMDCLQFLNTLRGIPEYRHLPVLILSNPNQTDYKAKAFELGANEFISCPFDSEDLLIRAKNLVRLKRDYDELYGRIRELEKTANVDPLTGLFNRKYLLNALRVELTRSRRHRTILGCLMVDLDNFKSINDHYGHQVGDHILQEVAKRLSHQLRGYDFAARYGGDEFIILLPQSSKGGALALAERLRHRINGEPLLEHEGEDIRLAVSIGIAALPGSDFKKEEDIILVADRALYEAKHHGRNQIAIAETTDRYVLEPPKGMYRRNFRKYQRFPFLVKAALVDQETGDRLTAYTINISYGGMAMYVQKPIPEKRRVQVRMTFPHSTDMPVDQSVYGTVRWVRTYDGLWGLGLEFDAFDQKDHAMILSFIQEAERLSP